MSSQQNEFVIDSQKSIYIGKAASPRCFKGVNVNNLPVIWRANRKAWMTTDLYKEYVLRLNKRMSVQQRNVLLFVDNAPSHPKMTLSHVKIIFLPAKTTSVLQPLDQGIIAAVKHSYRRRLLQTFIKRVEIVDALDLTKVVNVLDAVHHIAAAVKETKQYTIRRCFERCGFFPPTDAPEEWEEEDDLSLTEFMKCAAERFCITEPLSTEEYLAIDDDIPTDDSNNSNWEIDYLEEERIIQEHALSTDDDDQKLEDEEEAPVPHTYGDVIKALATIRQYALTHDFTDILQDAFKLEDKLPQRHLQAKTTQRSIVDFCVKKK